MNFRRVCLGLALSMCVFGQTQGANHLQQLFYSGSSLQYVCDAAASVAPTTVSVADSTLTSFTVSTNVGTLTTAQDHNLWIGAEIRILAPTTNGVSGTYYIKTVPSTTTYTVTTSGVADGTYTASNVSVATNSPRLNDPVWYVSVYTYSGSNLVSSYPGGGSLSLNYRAKCSNRTTY